MSRHYHSFFQCEEMSDRLRDVIRVMGDHDELNSPLDEFVQAITQGLSDLSIETFERFIEQQQ